MKVAELLEQRIDENDPFKHFKRDKKEEPEKPERREFMKGAVGALAAGTAGYWMSKSDYQLSKGENARAGGSKICVTTRTGKTMPGESDPQIISKASMFSGEWDDVILVYGYMDNEDVARKLTTLARKDTGQNFRYRKF